MTENKVPVVTLRGDKRLVIGWLQVHSDGSFSGQIDPLGSFTHEIIDQLTIGNFALEVDQTWLPGESLASMDFDYGATTELPKRQPFSAGYPAELLATTPHIPSAPFMYQKDALDCEPDSEVGISYRQEQLRMERIEHEHEQLHTWDFLPAMSFTESNDLGKEPIEETQDKEQ